MDPKAEVSSNCHQLQLALQKRLEENKSICRAIGPVLTEAHKYFMDDEEDRALELYRIAEEIALKFEAPKPSKDIVDQDDVLGDFKPIELNEKVTFEDVIGLEIAKKVVWTEFINPVHHKSLVMQPPRGVIGLLLLGSSGCGKTRLVEAIANEAGVPFYPILISQLQSKWKGESERLVTKLFQTVRKNDAAVVFLDEVEPLMGTRAENDSMGTLKSLFLQHMEGIESRNSECFILLVAATNKPEQLDPAFVSRFSHKILVRQPNQKQRTGMIVAFVEKRYGLKLSMATAKQLGVLTEGHSGRAIVSVLQSLNYIPMHRVLTSSEFSPIGGGRYVIAEKGMKSIRMSPMDIGTANIVAPKLREVDVVTEFQHCRRSTSVEPFAALEMYAKQIGAKDGDGKSKQSKQDRRPGILDCVLECTSCVAE